MHTEGSLGKAITTTRPNTIVSGKRFTHFKVSLLDDLGQGVSENFSFEFHRLTSEVDSDQYHAYHLSLEQKCKKYRYKSRRT